MLLFVAISAVFHGLVLAAVGVSGLRAPPVVSAPAARPAEPSMAVPGPPPPSPSCDADVVLATAARMLYCSSPLHEGKACVQKSISDMSLWLITCDAVAMSTEVSLLSPEQVEEIEPEPLIEFMDPLEQKKFEEQKLQALEEKVLQEQKRLERPVVAKNAQVVEITRPNVEKPPVETRFLSEYDSQVEKQTVARGSTEDMVERPQDRNLTPRPDPREASAAKRPDTPGKATKNPDAPVAPGKLAMRAPGQPQPRQEAREATTAGWADGSDAPVTGHGFQARKGNSTITGSARDASDGTQGQGGGGGGRPLLPNLQPTEEVLERVLGGGSVDHLDDVEQGEVTALSSKRWKYATFFNRIKRQVAQNWHPGEVYARRDPTGNVYGTKDRITHVQVSLNPRGAVVKIHILQGSGVDFLDDEAVRAFQAAQPFPNPPAGLVDQDSQLITFAFSFHVENSSGGGWKIFRRY